MTASTGVDRLIGHTTGTSSVVAHDGWRLTPWSLAKRRAAVARAVHNDWVSSYGYLRVGSLIVSHLQNDVGDELMTLFRDDMLGIRHALGESIL